MNPALLIAIALLAAFLSVMFKKYDKIILSLTVLFNLVYSVIFAIVSKNPMVYMLGGFKPPFGISLVVDNYALVGIVLLNTVFALIVTMSFGKIGKYSTVMLVSLAALNGLILTGDLFNLFVFLEIGSIAIYIMVSMNKGYKQAFNYLILGSLASGLYLFGIAILYNIFGTLNMSDMQGMMNTSAPLAGAVVLPLILIFVGLSVEAKLMPFSGWVRGILSSANSLVGTLIVSAYATAILFVFGRLMGSVFMLSDGLVIAFSIVAVATLTLAEFSALGKKNLREIFLFSSIAQSGLVAALFINGLTEAAVMVLINNVVSKLILFTLSAKIEEQTGSDNIYDLKGIFNKNKLIGLGFTVAAMSLIGLPFFYGFAAKAKAMVSLFDSGNLWLPAVILAVSVIEGSYVIRILANLWNTGEEGQLSIKAEPNKTKISGSKLTIAVAVLVAVVILAAGILPLMTIKDFFTTDLVSFVSNSIGGV